MRIARTCVRSHRRGRSTSVLFIVNSILEISLVTQKPGDVAPRPAAGNAAVPDATGLRKADQAGSRRPRTTEEEQSGHIIASKRKAGPKASPAEIDQSELIAVLSTLRFARLTTPDTGGEAARSRVFDSTTKNAAATVASVLYA